MVSNTLTGPGKKKKAKGKKGTKSKSSDHLNKSNDVQDTLQDPLTQGSDQDTGTDNETEQETDIVSDTEKTEDVDKGDSGKGDPSDDGTGSGSPDNGSGDPSGSGDPKGDGSGDGDSKGGGGGGGGGGGSDSGDGGDKKGGGGLGGSPKGGPGAKGGSDSAPKPKAKAKKGGGGGGKSLGGGDEKGGGGGGGGGSSAGSFATPAIPQVGSAPVPSPGLIQPLLLSDPKIDEVLVAGTGLTSLGHQNLMLDHTAQLTQGVDQANNMVLNLGQSLQSDTLSFGSGLSSDLSGIQLNATTDLNSTFTGVLSNVKGVLHAAKAKTSAAMKKAQEQVNAVKAKSVADEQKAFKAAASLLTSSKAQWEGSYEKTVKAQAQKMREMGAAYEKAAQVKEAGHRANYKALGRTGNPEDALSLAEERAAADTFKTYAPEFAKYAKLAAMFLDNMAKQAKPLSEKILAPTLEALYPLEEANEQTLDEDSKKLNTQVDSESKSFEKSTKAIETTQVKALETGGKEAVEEVNLASESLQKSTEASLDKVNNDQATAVQRIQNARVKLMSETDSISQQLSGSSDSVAFEQGKKELLDELDRDTGTIMSVLESDQQRAKDGVLQKHNQQTAVIKDQSRAHSERVVSAGTESVKAVDTATTHTHGQLNKLSKEGNRVYAGVGKVTAKTATDSTAAVDTTSSEYQTELLAQVTQYLTDANAHMQDLFLKAVTASQSAGKTARGTQASALKTRSVNIYKAIDGWGTDESTLIKEMSGLTKSEARYTAARYKDKRGDGTSLRQAIIDDTSEGDNVREACLAYLEGKQALGAKYALKYASEGIWRVFGSDMDLINHTMSNMNEESRTALLEDPEFPAIKANIMKPTMAMDPVMILATGGNSYVGNAFFGPSKYELDTFAAFADPKKTLDQAKEDVQVIELAKAFDTDSMNPFKQGTDETKVFEILGKLEGEALEKFKAKFQKYKGISLEDEIKDEFQGLFEAPLEYKRAMALANGDKAKADAYALQYSLNRGKEEEVFGLLEDQNLVTANEGGGQDWLANQKAKHDRQELNTAYESQTNSTLSSDIDSKLKNEDAYSSEIAQSYLKGETADPKHLLAFAILGNGTNEPYAQKAINQLLQDVQKAQAKAQAEGKDGAKAGKKAWEDMKAWFKDNHGITDLEKYLGVGDDMYAEDLRELDGQERQDFNDVLMQVLAEPGNIVDEYKRVHSKWEWYRGKGGSLIGGGLMDLYSDSGGDLDHKLDVLKELMADTSWYDTKTGKPKEEGSAKHEKFKKYVELLDAMGGIYKDQRETLTDGICAVVTTIAAIVSTIVTLGAAGPLWVGIAISAGAAALNVMIKAEMKGNAYGPGEALTDVSKIAGEALVGMATAGLGPGPFKQFGKFLNTMADKGLRMKLLSEVIKGVPGEMQGILMDEKTWNGDWDEFAAMVGISSFKLGANALGGVINEKLADQVAAPGKKWMAMVSEPITEILADPDVMAGDEIALTWLKKTMEKFVGNVGAEANLMRVSNKINKLQKLDNKTTSSLANITDDAAADLQTRLNIEHQVELHNAHPNKFSKPVVPKKKPTPDGDKHIEEIVDKNADKDADRTELTDMASDLAENVSRTTVDDTKKTVHHDEKEDGGTKSLDDTDPKLDKHHEEVHENQKAKSNDTKSDGVPVALTGLEGETLRRALDDVHGIGPVLSKKVRDYIEAGGKLDSHTDLQSITGIGPVLSERIWTQVKGRSELHNHQNGVFEVEDLLKVHASADDAGKHSVLDHIESTYNGSIDKEIGKLREEFDKPTTSEGRKKRILAAIEKAESTREKIKEVIDQRHDIENQVSNDKLLQELLVAGKLDYDQVYSVRKMVTKLGYQVDGKGYYDILLARLASQGISYIEVTGGQAGISDTDLRTLMDKHGVELRYLKSVRSRETLGNEVKKEALEHEKNGINAQVDEALNTKNTHTVGIDYLGAEPMFQEGGKKAFIESSLDMATKLKAGQVAVIRVHVGEGYFSEGKDRAAEVQLAKANIQGFIDSVKVIQAQIKEGGIDGEVQIRAGHVTHATDAQLVQLRQLGVHVEVNLGSNKKTRAVTDFAEHPLLRMLYLGVDLSINTDAGGVMATTLQDEYRQAESMIEAFKEGAPIVVDGKTILFEDMSTVRQNRFDIQRLEERSRQYQQIDRDNK